ncbi:uncharacterized protein TM35_001381030 [Trypanosoma theileri]|uniref:Mucin TcMUCII n=1 Tax=Trypanosoma theileri TaxID=67003 RepID=A0A1X0NDE0_9TRYP|nr:uncharacterized protein TM35_001381030 [Trypanosoma theileri]ORC80905.1 hypothetical protein TM35_001381030 [Trypanosoma theileri]
MQVRRVLYFLALIMSVASVCVATTTSAQSESLNPEDASHRTCTGGDSATECLPGSPGPAEPGKTTHRGSSGNETHQESVGGPGQESGSGSSMGSVAGTGGTSSHTASPNSQAPDADTLPTAPTSSDDVSSTGPLPGGSGSNPHGGSAAAQSPSSPNIEGTGSETGVADASAGNGTKPEESEAPDNSGVAGNADTTPNNSTNTDPETPNTANNEESTTTTTTTTIPPEPANNKKGDADSSSSISSSVWVRVPLLIVVTLACILVC